MGLGLAGTRETGAEVYAEKFQAAGLSVLLFDYRHWGASDGEPRNLFSTRRQLADWAAAIAHARTRPDVDPNKVALWGTSFSGGHVLVAAAQDGRVAAVSSQGPMVDGTAAVLNLIGYAGIVTGLKLTWAGIVDQALAVFGSKKARYVQVIAKPGGVATMASADAFDGYSAILPTGWTNQISARMVVWLGLYRPTMWVRKLTCPTYMGICKRDSVAPAPAARRAAAKLPSGSEVREYDCGHFDIYVGADFDEASEDQLNFLVRTLAK
jgi:uncharacterized protein